MIGRSSSAERIASNSVAFLIILLFVPWSDIHTGVDRDAVEDVTSGFPQSTASVQTGCYEEERYSEDFEKGWATDWSLGQGFQIVSAGAGKALQGGNASSSFATYLWGDYWTDLSFSFKIKLSKGEVWASVHYNSDGQQDYAYDRVLGQVTQRYYVGLTLSSVFLGRSKSGVNGTLSSVSTTLDPSQPYSVRISAVGGQFSVYVNDSPLISTSDSDPIPSGTISLETKSNTQAQFDDLLVVAKVPCEYTWRQTKTSPIGGDVNIIAVDPTNASVAYAGMEHAGLWKSTDSGLTWIEVGYSGDMGRLGKTRGIAIAPSDNRIVYAGWAQEVDASGDGGLHWTRTSLLKTPVSLQAVSVSPDNPNVVYAALGESINPPQGSPHEGIFKSSDGGKTWVRLDFTTYALAIAIPSSSPSVLYVGGIDGVYKSTDAGNSWTKMYSLTGTVPGGVPSVAVDPTNSNMVYAIANGTIKSTDGGSTWVKVSNGGDRIVVSPANPQVLYQLWGSKIFRSGDQGTTWTGTASLTDKPYMGYTLAADPSNPDKVYVGTWGQGIFFSKDQGKTWSRPNVWSVPADLGAAVAVDPSNKNRIYVGTSKGEVYVTADGGGNWTRLAALGTGGALVSSITGLVINPSNPSTLFASNVEGIYKSADGGVSWTKVISGLTDPRIISLTIDPKNPNKLYAGTGSSRPRNTFDGTGIFYSTNGGDSWSHFAGLPAAPIPAIALSPVNTSTIYAAAMGFGVYRSLDGGVSWTQVNTGLSDLCVYALAMDPKNSGVLYVGTNSPYCKTGSMKPDNVYKTEDGGTSWKVALAGTNKLDYVEGIAVSPADSNKVYVTYHSEKVWFSSNAGSSWSLANQGVIRHGTHLYLWAMATDLNGTLFYISSCGMGVLKNAISAPETPYTAWKRIIVDKSSASAANASVNSSQSLSFHVIWSDTGSAVSSGLLFVNSKGYNIGSSGWVNVTLTSQVAGQQEYKVTGAYVNGYWDFDTQATDPKITWLTKVQTLPFSVQVGGRQFTVSVETNSSSVTFAFFQEQKSMTFTIMGQNGTKAYAKATFAKVLLNGTFSVTLDGSVAPYRLSENSTYYSILVNYTHSQHILKVTGTSVIPEFPTPWQPVALLTVTLTLGFFLLRRYNIAARC